MPDGASFFWSWCSSMISTSGMVRRDRFAAPIISTAPIAKFGATKQLASPSAPSTARELVQVESGAADHGVHAGLDRLADVRGRRLGRGEVDHHVGALEYVVHRPSSCRVGAADQLQAVGGLDRPQAVSPMRPAAPETTTLIGSAIGDLMASLRSAQKRQR